MFTFVAALKDEIKLIRAEMEIDTAVHIKPFSVYSGILLKEKINLVKSGVGKNALEKAVLYCLKHLPDSVYINIGYAGGLDPRLHAGDIVLGTKTFDEKTGEQWSSTEGLLSKAVSACAAAGLKYQIGAIVTVEKALATPHEKAFAGTQFEAIACDMESSRFAEILTRENIPFLMARVILDPMDTELPDIPEEAIINGEFKIGKFLGHIVSKPRDILKLPKINYLCNQARITLTNFVKELVKNEKGPLL